MSKLEVHTLRFGDTPWMRECAATLDAWCKRHGYELIVWDDSRKLETPKLVQKNMLDFFLKGGNSHMLYVDADVYINPNAPAYPAPDAFSIATDRWHTGHNAPWQKWAEENYGKHKGYKTWDYSNAGVWSTDVANGKKFLAMLRKLKFVEFYQEQHWFNAAIVHSGIVVERMSSAWNRYCRDFEPSHFFHLWGEKKEENLAMLKRLGLLDRTVSERLRHCMQPRKIPRTPKIIELEFIKDAGLGNQMFEWAAAYSIARTLNLPLRWTWKDSEKRDFGLTHFGLGKNPARQGALLLDRVGQGNKIVADLAKQRIKDSAETICRIKSPFQAEECFIDHAEDIANLFYLTPATLPNPRGTTPVGVQVRRGDYLTHSRLNVTTPEYFTNAMKWMAQQVSKAHFIVVSDDPEWCEKFFGYRKDVTVMPSQDPIEGLRTLSTCRHNITSNSTFGWWGAWLAERRHGVSIVAVPEVWHHGGTTYGQWEPIPDRWHRIALESKAEITVATTSADPKDKRAIVYPWKANGEQWHELRYSLRSIYENFEDKDCPIYILGTEKPSWLIEGGRVRYVGAFTYQEALTKGLQLAEQVLWMNDDIVMLKPTTWADCEVTLYEKPIPDGFIERANVQSNKWREGVVRVLKELAKNGITEQKVFSTHTPYVFRRKLALEVLRKYGTWEKFPMEMAYFHHHGNNVTRITTEKTTGVPFGEARFLNYADRNLTEVLKRELRTMFTITPPWELKVDYGA